MTRPDVEWQADAACAGLNGREGTPDFLGRDFTVSERKRKCAGCPVRLECLSAALVNEQGYAGDLTQGGHLGIVYGGLDGRERQALHRCYRGQLNLAVVEAALS